MGVILFCSSFKVFKCIVRFTSDFSIVSMLIIFVCFCESFNTSFIFNNSLILFIVTLYHCWKHISYFRSYFVILRKFIFCQRDIVSVFINTFCKFFIFCAIFINPFILRRKTIFFLVCKFRKFFNRFLCVFDTIYIFINCRHC